MRARALMLAAAIVASTAAPAPAYVPEQTPARNAQRTGYRLLAQEPARGALAGVAVMRGGRILFGRNVDVPMVPASLMKLATTTTAMLRFGPRHRFATRVMAVQPTGVVGDLYLVGGGDPTFATRAYRRVRFLPKPTDAVGRPAFPSGSPTVEDLAALVARAGITRVSGSIVADDSLFDRRRTQRGWLSRYLFPDPDTGLLSALTVNEGIADLERTRVVSSPTRAAGAALLGALQDEGVRVDGGVRIGRAPAGLTEVANVKSPPLRELIDFINRYSINFPAELLLKSLGAHRSGRGTTRAGVAAVRSAMEELGVPLDGFVMTDGSGLSRADRMTPATLVAIVDRIRTGTGRGWRVLRASIPVAGRPGTLFTRMTRPPTGDNLRGKTGALRGVRTMAGWVTGSDGVDLTYVAMFNDARSEYALTGPMNLLGLLLALFPYA